MKEVVITGAARTAIGSLMGGLSEIPAPRLGAVAIAEAVSRSGIRKEDVEQVIMGNVLSAGMGQAPAPPDGLSAGIPESAGGLPPPPCGARFGNPPPRSRRRRAGGPKDRTVHPSATRWRSLRLR